MDREAFAMITMDVDGFPGYRIGLDGSIWTSKRGRWGNDAAWRKLKPSLSIYGYPYVFLSRRFPAETRRFFLHHLVLETFIGPRPAGADACHANGVRSDNRLSNLRWDSRKVNMADSIAHGTVARGEKSGASRLTEDQVREIRTLYAPNKYGLKRLGKQFGVAVDTIRAIVTRRTWAHVS
jgi:hypothetical protein